MCLDHLIAACSCIFILGLQRTRFPKQKMMLHSILIILLDNQNNGKKLFLLTVIILFNVTCEEWACTHVKACWLLIGMQANVAQLFVFELLV